MYVPTYIFVMCCDVRSLTQDRVPNADQLVEFFTEYDMALKKAGFFSSGIASRAAAYGIVIKLLKEAHGLRPYPSRCDYAYIYILSLYMYYIHIYIYVYIYIYSYIYIQYIWYTYIYIYIIYIVYIYMKYFDIF